MAITRTPMVDDDGTGTTGTIINAAWKTEFYNQIDAAVAGGPGTAIPNDKTFVASDFSARAPLVFTAVGGGGHHNVYGQVDKLVTWSINVGGTTSGSPDPLIYLKFPVGAWIAARTMYATAIADFGAGGMKPALAYVSSGATSLTVQPLEGNWPIGSIGVYVSVQFFIQ